VNECGQGSDYEDFNKHQNKSKQGGGEAAAFLHARLNTNTLGCSFDNSEYRLTDE
jgi:hypothetical protein